MEWGDVCALRQVLDNIAAAVLIFDRDFNLLFYNRTMLDMFGLTREEVRQFRLSTDFSAPGNEREQARLLWRRVQAGEEVRLERKARRPRCGTPLEVEVVLKKLHREGWEAVLATVIDITERRRAEEALRESERWHRETLASIEDGYYEVDLSGKITYCSESACSRLGYTREEMVGMHYSRLYTDPETVYRTFNNVFISGKPDRGFALEMVRKDGSTLYGELSISLIRDRDGRITGFRGVGRDITERKQFEDRLRYLSLHDQLTGLYNRTYFEEELLRLEGGREYPVSIICVDLDGLKLINDTLGHRQGDTLLKSCAEVLRAPLRKSDILARVGGDEFAVLLPCTGERALAGISARIREAVLLYNTRKMYPPLGISIGEATSPGPQRPLAEVFTEADDRMYREKLRRSEYAREQIVRSLLSTLAAKDFQAQGHAERLEMHCRRLGARAGLTARQLSDLALLAKVHDLGIVGVPDSILFKAGPLTEEEWAVVKQHPERGYRIARSCQDLAAVAELILRHHERWDGQGYPLGLKGEEIPLECRLFAVADAYEVMLSGRSFRPPKTPDEARAELRRCASTQFDPRAVALFLQLLEEAPSLQIQSRGGLAK